MVTQKHRMIGLKVLIFGFLGTGAYFLIRFAMEQKKSKQDALNKLKNNGTDVNNNSGAGSVSTNTGTNGISTAGFPLKMGSDNGNVKLLQLALIAKYGRPSVLPKYGADGKWGAETESAVSSKLGIHSVSDANQLQTIIMGLVPGVSSSPTNLLAGNGITTPLV